MKDSSRTPRILAAVGLAATALSACFDPALAQSRPGFVQQAPQPAAPRSQALPRTAPAGVPAIGQGLPTAAGISPPSPFPAGLPSPLPFPSGTPSSVIAAPGAATDTRAVIQPGTTGTLTGNGVVQQTDATGTVIPNTAVMGAGAAGAATMGSPNAPAPRTPLEVVQTFNQADMNRDGGLTRAEAQRIALPNSFEELDRNKDGVLSRGEYEDAF